MEINKIVKLKDNKYKIQMGDITVVTYDNVIIDNNLLYKKYLDDVLYNKILRETSYYDTYNKTIKYILKKKRSEKEILEYLSKYDLSDNDKNRIITKLKNINLINDLEFCKSFINDKIYLSKNGINKIKSDLLNHNIPIEIIDKELNNIDVDLLDNRLEKMILKKINSNNKYSKNFLKQKILNDMINLGYSKDKINEILDKHILVDNNIIIKEFDKLYSKLKIKYVGFELKNKIIQKLLSKGFSLNDINTILKNKTEEYFK